MRAEGNFGSWRETKLREFRELEKNEIKRISGAEQNSGNSRRNSFRKGTGVKRKEERRKKGDNTEQSGDE